ncbi:DUF4432 family protein [Opitutaceae bacterium]|nr:DUF4432 family protein [Opitutaceae bacterium]MDB4473665.1 DUF4432 family protein [Opitutaceae bacterium]
MSFYRFSLVALFVLGGAVPSVLADSARAMRTELHGREAYTLENDAMRISMLTGGGFIGEVRFRSKDAKKAVNPLRVPHYQTFDPQNFDPARHQSYYGTRLGAGYMGSFLCFPYIGKNTVPAEIAAEVTTHGEAVGVKWEIEPMVTKDGSAKIVASTELPVTRYRVRRTLTLRPEETVVRVDEEVENLTGVARPYQWGQHLTFGPPFLASGRTFADAPVSKILYADQPEEDSFNSAVDWPNAIDPTGRSFDASIYGITPGGRASRVWFMDPDRQHTWATLFNADHRVLIGHVFPKTENPWILDWQENRSATNPPWEGQGVARALLVGTGAFGLGLAGSIEQGEVFDTPIVAEIGAHETLRQSYLIFLAEIESGFQGVDELKVTEDSITLIERTTGNQIKVNGGGKL